MIGKDAVYAPDGSLVSPAVPGKMRRVPDGMLPEATDAFLDEVFNGNGPLLHSVMPALNERVWHNNGHPVGIPLRQALAGTNKLNADSDLAALWDRWHQRWVVEHVRSRTSLVTMAAHNIARMAQQAGAIGAGSRGVNTAIQGATRTTVTLEELDRAHAECLSLDFPPAVLELALDLKEELQQGEAKVTISERRWNEGLIAVAARAWVRGHHSVTTGDLDVLANMWWTLQDQMPVARKVILGATNPGEKVAHELLDDLDQAEKEYRTIADPNEDDNKRRKVGISVVGTAEKIIKKAGEEKAKALAAGNGTAKLDEVIQRAHTFNVKVGTEVFGLSADSVVMGGTGA
jgi:MoxR-like ATPase